MHVIIIYTLLRSLFVLLFPSVLLHTTVGLGVKTPHYKKENISGTNHENKTFFSLQKRERTMSENSFHTHIQSVRLHPSLSTVHHSDTSANTCAINVSFIKYHVEKHYMNLFKIVLLCQSYKNKMRIA